MAAEHLWEDTPGATPTRAIVGYGVEALDGSIGTVRDVTDDGDAAVIVVDTGPWLLGHRVVLPAGAIDRIDEGQRSVYVALDKQAVQAAPRLEEDVREPSARDELGPLGRTP